MFRNKFVVTHSHTYGEKITVLSHTLTSNKHKKIDSHTNTHTHTHTPVPKIIVTTK